MMVLPPGGTGFDMIDEKTDRSVRTLLREAGLPSVFTHRELGGSGNNRVYILHCGGARIVLKIYFHHPQDGRERLAAEYAFVRFAWDNGLRWVPKPIAVDPNNRMAIYEYIDGRPFLPDQVDQHAVHAALEFYIALNAHRHEPSAQELPLASEACFSVGRHLDTVAMRVARLERVDGSTVVDEAARHFIIDDLAPAWERLRDGVIDRCDRLGLSMEEALPKSRWRLSPSDFGFHNALITDEGKIRFVDFEYAGWDDPAKLIGDFFSQIAVPVPMTYFTPSVNRIAGAEGIDDAFAERARLLLPVYRIKWCCIVLNEFLAAGTRRHVFVGTKTDALRKRDQVRKAQDILARVSL